MKTYPASAPGDHYVLNESALAVDLELPVAKDFVSVAPQIDLQAMLRRIAENLPWRNARPGEQERRLAEKISEEFVL